MRVLVTGSNGLIGSEVVYHFCAREDEVHGIDNNMRADFLGPAADTRWNQERLMKLPTFTHHEVDIRCRSDIRDALRAVTPDLIVHAAAQPSHDLAASRPFDDFDVNAVGTLNLLEAARLWAPDATFIHMSTNKVYGDAPNEVPLVELATRWDYAIPTFADGINENCRIDKSKHSVFGASKVAADVMVQEYGRYFGMRTCCLRGGCITGPRHSGVALHGFLSHLIRTNLNGDVYRIYGYKGKQVRDNIHARDVVSFIAEFAQAPRRGEVYNIGGGRPNSCSILEAFDMAQTLTGRPMRYEYLDENREGDHVCYITDSSKARAHYPQWNITVPLPDIFEEIIVAWRKRSQE